MNITAIHLEEVSRRFGRHVALRRVSVDLKAGDVTALLGPNGAGKTTMMRLVATLTQPTRGRIRVQITSSNKERMVGLQQLAARSREFVGLVSHASLIYDDLSAEENLKLFGGLYGLAPELIAERTASMLERLGLTHARDRRVSDYSRGMRQRLSIARALIQEPPVVLLDEPFTGLDRDGCQVLYDVIREQRAAGRVVVLITHDLDLPRDLVDRAILLNHGQVACDERLEERSLSAWYEKHLRISQGGEGG